MDPGVEVFRAAGVFLDGELVSPDLLSVVFGSVRFVRVLSSSRRIVSFQYATRDGLCAGAASVTGKQSGRDSKDTELG